MSSIERALLGVALLVCLGSTAYAGAQSITLLGVSGAGGERFAALVEQDLGDVYQLVSGEVYRAQAVRLGRRGASPDEVRAVATSLRIDAVIGGAIVGAGESRQLLVAVREGATGRVVARGRYDLSGQTLPQVREHVVSDLVRALDRLGEVKTGPPPAEEPPPDDNARQIDTQPLVAVERPAPRVLSPIGLTAGVGLSLLSRSLKFDLPSAPAYSGGTVGGVRVDGAVFPLALSAELADAHPVLASFGLVGSYEHVFDFILSSSRGQIQGHASRWRVLLLGRIPLGHAARGGVLSIDSGFEQLNWSSESVADVGVPNVSYALADLGLGWEKSLGTRYAVLSLRVAYLGVFASGQISDDNQYGRASGSGVELEGGLATWATRWLWLRLDARYSDVALSFAGAGARFAHSAADQVGSGTLEVGLAL